ncbi:peroxiredoxin [Haloglomus salinum]|jgi:peroxiredoxin Q/BCP|uniref:peroxiredoxin n=1 Tax=Haloglomus salinum TaxID=2962673 RepID=UPI0020C9F4D6|nr:peroxiredoxin [Haloglomus salinum]
MLEPGDPAPDVSAPNQHGEPVTPEWAGVTVVYFYPEDETPGCTVEAQQFTTEAESYADAGVTVYGVSTDDVESHADFAEAEGVAFDLLADPEEDVCEAFGVPRITGRAKRTTFVVVDGEVERVYEGVDPDGHARDLLLDLLDDGVVDL